MGEPALRVIATELVKSIKSSVSVDWMHREAARARMRVLVKRLLRKLRLRPSNPCSQIDFLAPHHSVWGANASRSPP
jgi:hypothetical protein